MLFYYCEWSKHGTCTVYGTPFFPVELFSLGTFCDWYVVRGLCTYKKFGVPTAPGKPGKVTISFPVMGIWNFKIL